MKITQKHCKVFHQKCQKWIDKFKLTDWRIELCGIWKGLDSRAITKLNLKGRTASVWISDEWNEYVSINEQDLENTAKHEMLHILIGRLTCLADERYVREDELYEANEELVYKLENLTH